MAEQTTRPLAPAETAAFCSQLAMILKAGITLEEGIGVLLEDADDEPTRRILRVLGEHIELREPLCAAMEAAGCFPRYVMRMSEIGERSGRLDQVMESLAAFYEGQDAIAHSLRSAVAYPLVMVFMMLLVVGVLAVKVLPVFNEVFIQLGGRMSGLSRGIMAAGLGVARNAPLLLALLRAAGAALLVLCRRRGGLAGLFMTKRLSATVSSSRFASAMSLMLASGLDAGQALDLCAGLMESADARRRVADCKARVEGGASFAEAVSGAGLFPAAYARMVAVGFRTGSADVVLGRLAERLQEEADGRLSRMVSILEPTLVAALAVVVGVILLSVMAPLMGVMASIG